MPQLELFPLMKTRRRKPPSPFPYRLLFAAVLLIMIVLKIMSVEEANSLLTILPSS